MRQAETAIDRMSKAAWALLACAALACSDQPSDTTGRGGSSSTTTHGAGGENSGAGGSSSTGAGGGASTTTSSTSATTGSAGATTGATSGAGGAGPTDGGAGGSAGGQGGSGGSAGVPDGGARATYVFVSGYGNSIVTFAFDPASATLAPKNTPQHVQSASFLAWTNPTREIFALSELASGRVFGFSVNAATGALTPVNDVSSGGAGPAHILADPTNRWILVADYDSDTAAVVGVQPNGMLVGPAAGDIQMLGASSEAHNFALDPTNHYAFCALKGQQAIAQYNFDATTGKLTPNTPAKQMMSGDPRHIVFHPSGKYAYAITESASTMVAFTHAAGKLTEVQSLTTRASSGGGNSTGVAAMHPSGKWVYGSNRGDNDIVQYSINEADGRITLVGHTPSSGSTPRHFSLDPSGQFMFVANQSSNNVVVFRIGADGKPAQVGMPVPVAGAQPTFVGAAVMP
jgi:6-phosphogluconolactonase